MAHRLVKQLKSEIKKLKRDMRNQYQADEALICTNLECPIRKYNPCDVTIEMLHRMTNRKYQND